MIQRIQTIWLSLISLSCLPLFLGNIALFYNEQGIGYYIAFSGIGRIENTSQEFIQGTLPLSILLVIIFFMSVITVFLYKKRKLQIRFAAVIALLSAFVTGLLIYYFFLIINHYQVLFALNIKMLIPLLIIIFASLACRGIRKDENLVRSYDRLR